MAAELHHRAVWAHPFVDGNETVKGRSTLLDEV